MKKTVAVLGASGLVGRTMLDLLAGCPWVGGPVALTSARSAGKTVAWRDGTLVCREVGADSFAGVDLAVFSAGGDASRRWAPVAVEAGAVVIDNSSAWRMDPAAPLVVPEINGALLDGFGPGIIANPNCSTIQIAMAVAPLDDAFGVESVDVTTLQSVSGAGQAAVDALAAEAAGGRPAPDLFPRGIVANAVPAIGGLGEGGSYEEETKVVRELRKILGRGTDLRVSCTAVRVPVVRGHAAALRLRCRRRPVLAAAVEALNATPGVVAAADPGAYATPREAAGDRSVHVGRLRSDAGDDHALLCWVVADNILKGAAWNAVQIADRLVAGAAP